MRKQVKAQVTDLLDTMQEALVYISRGNAGWENLLYDCEKAFAEAENSFRCAKEDEHTALVCLLKIRDDFIALQQSRVISRHKRMYLENK